MLSRPPGDRVGPVLVALSLGAYAATGVAAGTGHLSWPAATAITAVASVPHLVRGALRDDDD